MQKAANYDRILTEQIDKLEEKKLNDIKVHLELDFCILNLLILTFFYKNYLKDYTHVQIIFHSKAVEQLTEAYQCLLDIDTESDLEVC
jgi:hypothetical protein